MTSQLGISGLTGLGHSVSWGDIDNDGDPDLALSNQNGSGYWLFRNDGDAFINITAAAGLAGMSANKTIFAEFTGDRYNDLLIRNFGTAEFCRLFENNGDGTFTNITTGSALPDSGSYTAADFDNDGNLDVICLDILGEGAVTLSYGNGDGTFRQFQQIGVLWGYTPVAVLDYDRDGRIDILWGQDYENYHPTTLLKNNGDGTFSNVTASAGISFTANCNSLDVGDIDNDGFIDIYFGGAGSANKLYLNNGDGTFTDITGSSGIVGQADSDRTATFNDYNNDGKLDIFTSWHITPNLLWRNNGNSTFTNVAGALGLTGGGYLDYFGVGWADYQNDGAIDFFAAGHFTWVMFENQNCPGNSLVVHLEGVQSNFNGIGARVDLWTDDRRVSRNLLPDPGVQDFGHLDLHLGMGAATVADSLIIYWPSGMVQMLTDVAAGQRLTVVEGGITGLGGESPDALSTALLGNRPNPFNPMTEVNFSLARDGQARLDIYDLRGRLVRRLVDGDMAAGVHAVVWNGRDGLGRAQASGVYLALLEVGSVRQTKRLALVR